MLLSYHVPNANDYEIKTHAMYKREIASFGLKMSFVGLSNIAQHP